MGTNENPPNKIQRRFELQLYDKIRRSSRPCYRAWCDPIQRDM